ncbi:helix-turn-helix domain-containing protein [Larkinella bovis]|uniref:Helix-turn-helix domain-containing protein n=1 Tax=Larkinella bovis TaxID=683041 RepID=A0ABW0IBW6_9BACT
MPYQLYDIEPRLRPFVKAICALEDDIVAAPAAPIRVLPDTCVELFINFSPPQQVAYTDGVIASCGRSFITTRLNHFMDVRTPGKVSFVSICFAPGQAYLFFPVPMHELANQLVDLRDLWGPVADELQERTETAKDMPHRVQLLQQYLLARLRQAGPPDSGVDFCINQIRQAGGQLSLEMLAAKTGLSNRQLIRRFNPRIGLSPKEFARITAFLNALKKLKKHPSRSLTEIAYESGYYDQAHFIHSCRDFTGLTPGQLRTTDHILC